jgi:hypothetical protein
MPGKLNRATAPDLIRFFAFTHSLRFSGNIFCSFFNLLHYLEMSFQQIIGLYYKSQSVLSKSLLSRDRSVSNKENGQGAL